MNAFECFVVATLIDIGVEIDNLNNGVKGKGGLLRVNLVSAAFFIGGLYGLVFP